jgi:uncharacterized membrane protein
MSSALDINDSGVIVGQGFVSPLGEAIGVPVWWPEPSGEPQRLDHAMALGDLLNWSAVSVNDQGQILLSGPGNTALLVDPVDYSTIEIVVPFALERSWLDVRAMNEVGDVVGSVIVDWIVGPEGQHAVSHAFAWRSATLQAVDLGTLPGAETSRAIDINDAGQIIGESDSRPFVWDPSTQTMTELSALDQVVRINDVDTVLGRVSGRPAVWDLAAKRLVDLPGGGPLDDATDFNDAGWITGYTRGSCPECSGFVWDPSTGTTFELRDGAGASYAINETGRVVGISNARAALWNPEPS